MAAEGRDSFASIVGNWKDRQGRTRVGLEDQASKFGLHWVTKRELLEQGGSCPC